MESLPKAGTADPRLPRAVTGRWLRSLSDEELRRALRGVDVEWGPGVGPDSPSRRHRWLRVYAELARRRLLRGRPSLVAAPFVFWLLTAPAARTQELPGAGGTAIRLRTDLVVIDALAVRKEGGGAVGGLKPEDFIHGLRQRIASFSREERPLSRVLLVDLSPSLHSVLDEIRGRAAEILAQPRDEDEAAVVAFAGRLRVVQGLTRDRGLLSDRAREPAEDSGGGTRLDAALHAASLLLSGAARPGGGRAIVAVTDTMPRFGSPSEREVTEAALESGAAVCVVMVRGWVAKTLNVVRRLPSVGHFAYKRVKVEPLAEARGGEVVEAGEGASRLAELLSRLRSRSSLGYAPAQESAREGLRRVRLELTPAAAARERGPIVLARRRYQARGGAGAAARKSSRRPAGGCP